jgi:signal transduction histidine kinase
MTPLETGPREERILVLCPTGRDGPLVCEALLEAGLAARECRDMDELCREIPRGAGGLLVSEEALDPDSTSCFLEIIGKQAPWSDLPTVLLGREGRRPAELGATVARLYAETKTVLIDRPVHVRTLTTLAWEELRSRRRQYQVHHLLEELETSHREVHRLNVDLERRVRERTAELEAMIGELRTFSYTVSHDLRAPLRTLSNLSHVLREDYQERPIDDVGRDYLQRIENEARRMDALIHDLLAYSRLAYADLELRRLEPGPLLKEILGTMADEIRATGAEVTLVEPFPAVRADRVLLSQALTNLLSNAIKFVAPGVPPRVRVVTEPLDGVVRLWVEDNGVGIAPSDRGRLFRVFERLSGDYPGTGIGLAIVHKAAERMRGRVGVLSEEGRGSRFWIELPKA